MFNPTGEVLKEILVDLVQKGDVLKILPGARIPTDGFILAGTAFIDESMITGESVPTLHVQGDAVFGSTVNQQSTIYVNATAIGSEVNVKLNIMSACAEGNTQCTRSFGGASLFSMSVRLLQCAVQYTLIAL